MRVAIMGLNGVNMKQFGTFLERGDVIVAVCDDNGALLAGENNTLTYTSNVDMLRSVKPDAVCISRATPECADMIIDALSFGIDVYCNAPLDLRIEDIPRIITAEEVSSAHLYVYIGSDHDKLYSFTDAAISPSFMC